jgi:hypothetical protein
MAAPRMVVHDGALVKNTPNTPNFKLLLQHCICSNLAGDDRLLHYSIAAYFM